MIDNAVVLVTGANGGLGAEFVQQALDLGAAKVYATARTPRSWDDERVVSLALDVTDEASVAAAAEQASDTTIVINNAGVGGTVPIATGGTSGIRAMFETNVFGAINVAQAFAPVLARNGGGALVDVHSVLSWLGVAGAYSASKAALWSATNSLRLELAPAGTHVMGFHLGYTDTPMVTDVTSPKNDPADVVRAAYAGLEALEYEVLADDVSVSVKQGLAAPISALYPQLAR
ncbi:NAD(P)-dependent dehydrogenase (short-subunit alcohol dehydrogenase family) [Microbacteriaceae bacterium SG_E_30_P1]|uniref:NAD(P)-dependent dehydrogenase (Short-subunit alcohol dehydrogenase family) n=1 Tax=Antiquaquibacter oligotrophicus TaxID=2880260 RepID=A0ABT6KSP6_9MICO|nr:SDR family oxidoreductase [Antiquaquibacter oligotrophicus]MDH6182222.1 NAD(P)-dependent dehydrogenase (short-subunit alcohol dehydrogenase family) [Antiquaquibacter oligotrophicus]UDF12118.1 SDR family oxidoreductase [Antiquaquibacter oligotrophicus]